MAIDSMFAFSMLFNEFSSDQEKIKIRTLSEAYHLDLGDMLLPCMTEA